MALRGALSVVPVDIQFFVMLGNITKRRMEAIELAFSKLDADNSNEIGLHEIQAAFNPHHHPQVTTRFAICVFGVTARSV